MFKHLAIAVTGLFLSCAVAKADECISVDKFSSTFASEGISLLGSKAAATRKMEKVFNENRARNGQPAARISLFLLGPLMTKEGPAALAAIVDDKGCIVTGSVTVLPVRVVVDFFNAAGVTIHDFVPLDGA